VHPQATTTHGSLFEQSVELYSHVSPRAAAGINRLCRGFLQLNPSDWSTAVDVLTANLRYICSSAQQLLSAEEQPSPETLQKHRNGLKMVVHLLHIISMHANKDAELSKGTENAAVKPAKGAGVWVNPRRNTPLDQCLTQYSQLYSP
jgi:hypothetical protein